MALNLNELILDKVRSLTAHSLNEKNYGEMLFRLTSLEDPSLSCTAEGEEVVDAIGALITTLYRAKKATFSASNSLISLDLAAAQYGTKKEVASSEGKISVPTYEVVTVNKGDTTVDLKYAPVEEIPYIYSIVSGEIGTTYEATKDETGAVSETTFAISIGDDNKTLTLPTDFAKDAGGKIYVEYVYESESVNRIVNKTSEFPESCSLKIYAYFRDKCNDNIKYSGVIVSPKAKLNPEQVELALTSTGKHAFEFQMMRDYCDEEAELFSIIVATE